ncbi:undecaprenyl/decaprenyl-phosphate alpha-N-acetylglucosaminyl 1-phosphate transferase, partial [Chryseobacterium sp. HMWF028]
KSPFDADKNHIHHKLLKLNLTHRRSTFYIILYYLMIVGVAYSLRHIDVNLLLLVILSLGFLGAYLPDLVYRLKK